MQFVTSALAFGALLFAVPLIIHLLNRQRFRKRDWAAMEFLLRAYKKQRRRLRTENLILLLLRCLIPIILALALARPIFQDGAGILPSAGSTHHVLVFDRSFSMGYQPTGSQSAHDKAIRLATRRLEQLESESGQKVTVILAGVRTEMPIRSVSDLAQVRSRLARIGPPTDSAATLLPALNEVADMLEEEAERPGDNVTTDARVYLFTDVQKRSFGDLFAVKKPADPAVPNDPGREAKDLLADNARELIDRIKTHAPVTIMDMGGAAGTRLDNTQITDLRMERAHAVADVPLAVTVVVRNLATTPQNIEVTLEKDSGEPSRKLVRVEPGSQQEVPFQVVFRVKGYRQLKASIQSDGLDADNACYRIVDVQDRLRVLMVEGSIENEYALMDSGWMRVILDPTQGTGDPAVTEFETKTIDATAFLLGQEKLQDYHAIVLANIERISERVAEDLKAAVQAGTGLLIMCGDRSTAENLNLHLYDNGEGPMPIRLEALEGYDVGGERYFRTQVSDLEHPVFADFRENEPLAQLLQLAGVYKYYRTDRESLSKNGKVLWHISSQQLYPLLVAGRYGEGRTLVLTSPITKLPKKLNTLDAPIHAVPLFHPMAHWLCHAATDPFNVAVGQSLSTIVRQRPGGLAVVVSERAGGRKVPVAQEARPLRGGLFSLPAFTETDHAGIYSYEMEVGESGSTEEKRIPFAVNPEPAEGELTYIAHPDLREKLGVENIATVLPEELAAASASNRSDLGPFLLYMVLFFILGEAAWARFVSRRRS